MREEGSSTNITNALIYLVVSAPDPLIISMRMMVMNTRIHVL